MKALALTLLAVLGLACAPPKQPGTIVAREYITVPAPPPQIPPRPALPTAQLSPTATLQDLIRALLADREALAAWALDLETRLKGYSGQDNGKGNTDE